MFAHQLVSATLTVGSKVAIFELVSVQALVTASIRVLKNGQRKARKAVHVHLIRG